MKSNFHELSELSINVRKLILEVGLNCGAPAHLGGAFSIVDLVINMPLLFILKNSNYFKIEGKTFKDFMNGKLLKIGTEPDIADFKNHLSTIFTEVRLKQYIEIRSLDTCEWDCHCGGPAFYTGLLYGALDEALDIINKWKISDVLNAYANAPKKGLNTIINNKTVLDWAKFFLNLSKNSNVRQNLDL